MVLTIFDILINNKLLMMFLIMILFIIIVAILWAIKAKKQKIANRKVAILGIFSALSIILYFLKFNLPFIFPSFLEINFSLLPIIIIGFMYGPVEGITLVLIRAIIKIPFTSTFCVGEVADVLIGVPVSLISSTIYSYIHTKKGAYLALGSGIIVWVFASIITNYCINVPFFIQLYCDGNINSFVGALSIIPGVNENNYLSKYVIYAVVPFNLLISSLVSIVTLLLYKRISNIFHIEKTNNNYNKFYNL